MKKIKYINREEKELIESYRGIDVKKVKKPSRKTQSEFKKAAKDFVANEMKMNIRIEPAELREIKKRAAIEGLKYQTFVKSVLHKYITGQLVEKRSR
jgi:predicted DNA binding CopG/RHH family protein